MPPEPIIIIATFIADIIAYLLPLILCRRHELDTLMSYAMHIDAARYFDDY